MKLMPLYSFLQGDLSKIEKALEQAVQSRSSLIEESSLHLLQAGGKRIRPVFVLLSGQFGSYNSEKMRNAAVALEMIHMASLVHDDVIDEAHVRRGRPTIKAKWDNRVAMYVGDYMFARSLDIYTLINDPLAHKILANTMVELVVGEIKQIEAKYRFDQHLKDYFRRIKRKTALLIAASCQIGAIVGNVEPDIHRKLYRFGYYVGMAYQITDDILDFTGTEEQLGKPAGGDLLQGNITLPVLLATKDQNFRSKLERVHEGMDPSELNDIITYIQTNGSIEKSWEISNRYLQKALQVLDELPKNKANKALRNIALYIGKRDH
ncbi:MAG TPA: heptaprenyl diphosphate synthase component II [Bacillus sp. (in: firmicutes)]|uniref:heptaprenyl diphosphate synthase component II n=1 Tax=Bacillus litorisediminis TaxID=2922713 RepID=UPI001FADB686|nr:heptaprenyl diphosphate synthase component II [Bacillus litorisediminis]HWO75865.1 heptaprenyl diphosphate synthase component II [Bacillus sp. (in: firmicutes)]